MNILMLNGPNLNLLGKREPDIYGTETLNDITQLVKDAYPDHQIECMQSNAESELVTWIGDAVGTYDGIIINPAALTHTSLGMYDALKAIAPKVPAIEVHLSNTHQREEIRHKSLTAAACIGQIMGFRGYGYVLAMHALARHLNITS